MCFGGSLASYLASLTSLSATFHCLALHWALDLGPQSPPLPCSMPQVPTMQTVRLRIRPRLALLRVVSLHQLRLLRGSSSHLGSGNTSSTFAPLAPEGDSSFPLWMVSGRPQCLPGALSAFLLPLVPAQNSWHGICLPVWTLLRHWPSFCYLNGCATLCFICPLQRSKCPYTSHQDVPPFLSLASPELLQIPGDGFLSKSGKALELEPEVTWSQLASTFLKSEKAQRYQHLHERSLLIFIQPHCSARLDCGLQSGFPVWQIFSPLG